MSHFATTHPRRHEAAAHTESPLSQLLLHVIDASLAGCLFLVPLMLGGRHPLGQLVLVIGSLTAAFACCLRVMLCGERAVWSHALWLFVIAMALGAFQLTPLPRNVIDLLSPNLGETLPLWTATSGLEGTAGNWNLLSLTPQNSRSCLVVFAAYGLLFASTLQRIRRVEDVERILTWMAWTAVLMAAFGIIQVLTSNGKFFWFYEHPYGNTYRVVKGSFVNRNHFADFMAMGLGPTVWCLLRIMKSQASTRQSFGTPTGRSSSHDLSTGFWMLGLVLVLFGGLMSLSRGGGAAIFISAFVCVAMFYRAGRLSPKILVGLGGIGILVFAFLFIYGQDAVAGRLDDFLGADLESLDKDDARRRIWAAVSRGIADYPFLGTGLGSHREVNPVYLSEIGDSEYSHAENGYLQVWLEAGTVGLLLLLTGMGLCGYWCLAPFLPRIQDARITACVAALAGGLVANAFHSVADFMWYIPGCVVAIMLLAACTCRLAQLSRSPQAGSFSLPRPIWGFGIVIILLLGSWMIPDSLARCDAEAHWDRYLILALEKDAEEDDSDKSPQKMISELLHVLKREPNHARARLRLARLLMIQFGRLQRTSENPMTIEQIRDAVQASQFATEQERDEWLARAVGPHIKFLRIALKQSRRGLAACPLQGDGYIYLAKLGFLEGQGVDATENMLEQALRLRPNDGRVLFGVGKEAFLRGELEDALVLWKKSFHAGVEHQRRLILLIAGQLPAANFIQEFEPDTVALEELLHRYRDLDQPENIQVTLSALGEALVERARALEESEAGITWIKAHRAFDEIGQLEQAKLCIEAAVRTAPNEFNTHYAYAIWARKQQDFALAADQFNWCARRRPNSEKLQRVAREAQLKATTERRQTATQSIPATNTTRLR